MSLLKYSVITVLTVFTLFFFLQKAGKANRLVLIVFAIYIYIYSGVGGSLLEVRSIYILYYWLYLVIFFYVFTGTAFNKTNRKIAQLSPLSKKISRYIIFIYIGTYLFRLLYPDFDISKLYFIKGPQLKFSVVRNSEDMVTAIIRYFLILMQPFYYYSLHIYKNKPVKLFISLMFPLVFIYMGGSYIGRSHFLPILIIYFVAVYVHNIKYRKYLIIGSLFLFVPLVSFLYFYTYSRLGYTNIDLSFDRIFWGLIYSETYYPLHFSEVVQYGYSYDISKFFKWIVTLPIPGFIKPDSFSADMNYKFTEDLFGISRYSPYFSVSLPGVVTESYYVFGKYLFIIMPIVTGKITGYFYRLTNIGSQYIMLKYYFIFFLGLRLARAGVGSIFPVLINGFLLYIIYLYYRANKTST